MTTHNDMPLCRCGAPMFRGPDPEPFASDFPGAVREYFCELHPDDETHGGYQLDMGRLTPTQRGRLAVAVRLAGLRVLPDEEGGSIPGAQRPTEEDSSGE